MSASTTGYERYAGVFTPTSSASPNPTQFNNDYCIVSPGFETETLLQSITAFPLVEIGNDKFMEAYCINLERLSIQAHLTAGVISARESVEITLSSNPVFGDDYSSGEYIVESFLEHPDKIEGMVETLLALEFWRENVLFSRKNKRDEYDELNEVDGGEDDVLAHRLASNRNGLRTAFILHAESTIVSLLGLIFYRGLPAALLEGNGDEVLMALIDYCARQLVFLGMPQESNRAIERQKCPKRSSELADYLAKRSRLDEIQDSVYDSTYQTAIASVVLSRYLCENINEYGPSLVGRICEVHDFPLLMVPLIEEPPWTRRRMLEKDGNSQMVWEKLNEHNEWSAVSNADLLRLTKLEGQPWLALYHLTASKVGRESYGLDEYRKTHLMRLRRYLNKALLDQVPVLQEVARYLDELSIMGVPPSGQGVHRPSSNASPSGLLLQRVDSLRESIVSKKQLNQSSFWNGVIQLQWDSIFSSITDAQDHLLRRIGSEIYGGSGELDNGIATSTSPSDLRQDHNDSKLALSRQVEKVVLCIEGGTEVTEFELTVIQGDSGKVTDTPLGQFRRIKLIPKLISGETAAVYPHGKVTAKIHLAFTSHSDKANDISLSLDSLDLPTSQPNSTPNSFEELGISLPDHFSSKEWRQLGDLHDNSLILQLGFKRLECGTVPAGCTYLRGYSLANSFISQPAFP